MSDLSELFLQFTNEAKADADKFNRFLTSFLAAYSDFVDLNFQHLAQRSLDYCPNLQQVPDDLLSTVQLHLWTSAEQLSSTWSQSKLHFAEKLISVLIIFTKNPDTIKLVASNEFIRLAISIAETIRNRKSSAKKNDTSDQNYMQLVIYYLECLYDPESSWRFSIVGWKGGNKKQNKIPAMPLHVQFVPFIHECFQQKSFNVDIQLRLFHLFGAAMSGSQLNALKAICPATLDLAMTVLQNVTQDTSDDLVVRLKSLVLQCVSLMIHIVHKSTPEERQTEVGAILDGYFSVLLKLCDNENNSKLQLAMIDQLAVILKDGVQTSSLRDAFMSSGICLQLVTFLIKISDWTNHNQSLAMASVRLLCRLLHKSSLAKENFQMTVGYNQLFDALKKLGQPSIDLMETLFDMAVEEKYDKDRIQFIRNSNVVIELIHWLPEMESCDLQSWLSTALYQLCSVGCCSRLLCADSGLNAALINCLHKRHLLDLKVVGDLLDLLESVASLSISQEELKLLIQLLKSEQENGQDKRWFNTRLLSAMSKMAAGVNYRQIPLAFLDFHSPDSGIMVDNLGRCSGSGFSFHAWICMEFEATSDSFDNNTNRRQLYSLTTSSGNGLEAFFTADSVLVVSVFSKKDRQDIPLLDSKIVDCNWHCIDIVHTTSKRPFRQSQLCIYIDEVLQMNTNLRFPALIDDSVVCKIGCGSRIEVNSPSSTSLTTSESKTKATPSIWNRLIWTSKVKESEGPVSPDVQDVRYGVDVSLGGQLAEVMMFMEPLLELHIESLYKLGPNRFLQPDLEGGLPTELPYRPLLWYNARATSNGTCVDLSFNGHPGSVVGRLCLLRNIKDVIHTVGGIRLLFILFDQAIESCRNSTNYDLLSMDLVVDTNALHPFLNLLCSLVNDHTMNQQSLMHDNGLAILGSIFQKANASMLDEEFHMYLKQLVEIVVASENKQLLHQVYKYLLFDFQIWSRAIFNVAIGHIQYLHTILKDDRKYFRKKYGVQYILDVIRMHYGTSQNLKYNGDELHMLRGALINLIKFYVGKEINFDEVNQLISFICAVHDEKLVCEVLDLLILLLELPSKKDQIYLLMYEPSMAELLYVLLTKKDYSVDLKEKILKIIGLLLKTDRVYEKSKSRLRLLDSNMFPGLISLMVDTLPSVYMTKHMLEQVFIAESESSINAAIYIIQTLYQCDIGVKLEAVRQLMKVLLSKTNIPKLFARQIGWQISLIRLFILRPTGAETAKWTTSVSDDDCHPMVTLANSTKDNKDDIWMNDDIDVNRRISFDLADITEVDPSNPTSSSSSKFTSMYDFGNFDDPYQMPGNKSASSYDFGSISSVSGPPRSLSLSEHLSTSSFGSIQQPKINEKEIMTALKEMGLKSLTNRKEDLEMTEEVCQNLLIILFTIMWKGVETSDELAWKERGQVFAAINYTAEDNELIISKTELTRKLLELLLQGCIMDLKQLPASNLNNSKNALQIMKLVFHFLCIDNGAQASKFSEQLLEDMLTLFDLLSIWQPGCEWMELEQIGLRCLLLFAAQDTLYLCSGAAARLHTLIQSRPVEKLQESCFIVAMIHGILSQAVTVNNDQYNILIPVMKALLEKCEDMLNIATYLPQLPNPRNNPLFCDEFKAYCQTEEWKSFMVKQVVPSKEQYQANIYEGLAIQLTAYMGSCHEEMMVNGHKRDRQRGEAKLKFENDFVTAFRTRLKQEDKRYNTFKHYQRSQNIAISHHWKMSKQFFSSERGTWPDKSSNLSYYKLSTCENFARMRPKLVFNENFDNHAEASRLRDNQGYEEKVSDLITLAAEVKEAKVSTKELGDDRLGDDEWNLISTVNAVEETDKDKKDKIILSEECELVTIMDVIKGRLDVTATHLYFFDLTLSGAADGKVEDVKIPLDELREIHFRRYNLRRSALEFFLLDQKSYFINFQKKVRNKVYSRILSLRPPNLIYYQSRSPAELLKSSGLTQRWVQREISNFEYLMHLNTISGRTYNDLSQYPVFPWILSDYTSSELNLEDPKVFRDLSRPVGICNPIHEESVREKYEHFEDPCGMVEKFHYGTHYSNPAGVMHYLIRLEPFTTLHIQLQSDKFDVADRQFHSIASTWQGLMDNPNDVKELIPEFFYFPEFLVNMNDFDLGRLQFVDDKVDDVILPAWASSPYDFINKHMQALESDYVSSHLNNWIDLIFGYKQQGPAAIEALNVFYYCTYEGAVDLDAITDPSKRKAFEGMINNFGQTPCQLLKDPHPKRMTLSQSMASTSRIDRLLKVFQFPNDLKLYHVEGAPQNDPLMFISVPKNQSNSFMQQWSSYSMVVVTRDGGIGLHGWLPYDKSITSFFTFTRDQLLNNLKTRKKLPGIFSPDLKVTSKLFAVSHDAKLVFSGGYWDNSVQVYSLSKGRQVAHVAGHTDIVTCMSLDNTGRRLITGSRDTTSMIWEVTFQGVTSCNINPRPLQVLCGHEAEITCVAIATELDMAVSSSKDGTIIMYTVRQGLYVRTLRPPHEKGWQVSVDLMALSDCGEICVYCRHTKSSNQSLQSSLSSSSLNVQDRLSLHLYSVNGKHLSKELIPSPVADLVISGNHLLVGSKSGVLYIKQLYGLQTISSFTLHAPINCISVTEGGSHILVGLEDSNIIIVTVRKLAEIK